MPCSIVNQLMTERNDHDSKKAAVAATTVHLISVKILP